MAVIRDPKHKRDLVMRLKRVEGQLRGIQAMIAASEDCEKVAQQISASRRAPSFARLSTVSFDLAAMPRCSVNAIDWPCLYHAHVLSMHSGYPQLAAIRWKRDRRRWAELAAVAAQWASAQGTWRRRARSTSDSRHLITHVADRLGQVRRRRISQWPDTVL